MIRLLTLLFAAQLGFAQCAMCFRSAEAQSRAQAVAMNRGILLMLVPALGGLGLIGIVAYSRRARKIATGGDKDWPRAGEE